MFPLPSSSSGIGGLPGNFQAHNSRRMGSWRNEDKNDSHPPDNRHVFSGLVKNVSTGEEVSVRPLCCTQAGGDVLCEEQGINFAQEAGWWSSFGIEAGVRGFTKEKEVSFDHLKGLLFNQRKSQINVWIVIHPSYGDTKSRELDLLRYKLEVKKGENPTVLHLLHSALCHRLFLI